MDVLKDMLGAGARIREVDDGEAADLERKEAVTMRDEHV